MVAVKSGGEFGRESPPIRNERAGRVDDGETLEARVQIGITARSSFASPLKSACQLAFRTVDQRVAGRHLHP